MTGAYLGNNIGRRKDFLQILQPNRESFLYPPVENLSYAPYPAFRPRISTRPESPPTEPPPLPVNISLFLIKCPI